MPKDREAQEPPSRIPGRYIRLEPPYPKQDDAAIVADYSNAPMWRRALGGLCISILFFFIQILPIILTISVVMFFVQLPQRPSLSLLVLLVLVILCFYPRRLHVWPWWVCGNPMWALWASYFRWRAILAHKDLDPTKKYIFLSYPHGIFPMGQWLLAAAWSDIFPPDKGWRYTKGAGADVTLRFPIVRHMYGWFGVVSAAKDELIRQFKTYNLTLVPGGIAELYRTRYDSDVLYITKRLHTTRFAFEQEAIVIPVYHFGVTSMLTPLESSWLERLGRRLRFSIVWTCGVLGLPIPRPVALTTVLGRPMDFSGNRNPTDEDVERAHAALMDAVEVLYREYAGATGYGDRPLRMG